MILTELGPLTAYRMHTPRRATAPTSGAGAAEHGGRANRPGASALYLALEPETAVREYQQLSPLMPPASCLTKECYPPVVVVPGRFQSLQPSKAVDMWSKAASATGSTRVFHQCFALTRLLTQTMRPEEQNRIKIFVLDVSAHHRPDPR